MRKTLALTAFFAATAFGYTVQVDLDDVDVRPAADAAFLGYEVITLRGGGALPVEPGEPALPAVVATVALPMGTEIESVDVFYGEPVALPGSYRLVPEQEPIPVSIRRQRPTPPDASVYSSAEPFPGKLAYSFESGNMGGYGVGSVVLAPVQYEPATGKVLVYTVLDFKLNLKRAADNVYPKVRLDWVDRNIRESLEATVINPWEVTPPGGVKLVGGKDNPKEGLTLYLIITDESLAEAAQPLADWKTKKGFRAAVVTTSYIEAAYPGRDFAEMVRNCIVDYYQNFGTQYVCLVGTNDIIPLRDVYDPVYPTGEGDSFVPTDNYYGCLDGDYDADGDGLWGEYNDDDVDWVYDVYVGRIQAYDADALARVIDKTLCYEGAGASAEVNPYDYQNQVILAGGWLDSTTNSGLLMEFMRDNYFTSPHWLFSELWDPEFPGGEIFNSTAFISKMNEGKGLIAHAAHSSTHVLGTNAGYVTSEDLYWLGNAPRYSGALYSLGCYASNADFPDNCAAGFVNSNGGGVGFVGNTRFGFYAGSPVIGYSADFMRSYFSMLNLENTYVSGQLLPFHKHVHQGYTFSWAYRYIYFELTHTGDPDIWIPNGDIGATIVDYEEFIGTEAQTYTVHVYDEAGMGVPNALVCVWKEGEVYGAGATDDGGAVSFDVFPATEGTMYLTVSAHNMITFEADVTVETTAVRLTSFTGERTKAGVRLDWEVGGTEKADYFNLYRRPVAAAAIPAGGDGEAVSDPAGACAAAGGGTAAFGGGDGWARVNEQPVTGRSPYQYLDRDVEAVLYEYKLEAVLPDGADELGTTRVDGALPVTFAFGVAPNPASTAARVLVDLPEAAAVKVSLYDLSGRRVATVMDRVLNKGKNAAALDVAGMPAGVYILRLEAGGRVAAKRLAVVH